MRKLRLILLVLVVLIIAAFVGARLFYFGGLGNAYTPPQHDLEPVKLEAAPLSAHLEAVDNPEVSRGVVVFDFNHNNALFIEELNVLYSRVVSRGFSYEVVDSSNADKEGQGLLDRLRYADALVLPLPRNEFTAEEIEGIKTFVDKGGRLLIIGDPTRTVVVEALNSIAGAFNIIYANDYLYSLENNDNNYRNVVYSNFNESPVTAGLGESDKVVFYGGGSISAPGHEIILGDETTYSSISEGGRTAMAAAALTNDGKVLALGDLTFFSEPYSTAESNAKLISNVADFLTGGERDFELEDFPHFFSPQVDVVFDDTFVFNSQFEDSVQLKSFLESEGRTVNFANEIGDDNDVIFMGRFDQADAVQEYLEEAGIILLEPEMEEEEEEQVLASAEGGAQAGEDVSENVSMEDEKILAVSDKPVDPEEERFIEGRIQVKGVGDLERGGSTLFYRHQEGGRNILIILSANSSTNADAFELLLEHEYTECLVDPNIAVCQTEDPDEKLAPSVRSTRIDKILVVSDTQGRSRNDEQTSAADYYNVLSTTYKIDTWFTIDGELDLDELQEYDAIIWTTGDYWDDSIDEKDAELLTEYIAAGGNLILSGSSIAFDWDHTEFLANIAHADYLTFAEQKDIKVALVDHPLAKGFTEDQVIDFVASPSGEPMEPDVVNHAPNSRVIFKRGAGSEQADAPSVIAFEDDRSKIAYYVFPLYMLPDDAQAMLVNNTIDWFTRRPLDLPSESDYEPFETDETQDEATDDEGAAGEGDEGGEGEEGTGEEDEGDSQEDEGSDEGEEGDNGEDEGDGEGDEGDGGGEGEEGDGGEDESGG